jgi:hypothetical protein
MSVTGWDEEGWQGDVTESMRRAMAVIKTGARRLSALRLARLARPAPLANDPAEPRVRMSP